MKLPEFRGIQKMDLRNKTIEIQTNALKKIMSNHNHISNLMKYIHRKTRIENWYICGGCIPTITWNTLTGNSINQYLNDIDLIYYDTDISESKEMDISKKITEDNPGIPYKIDLKNQARMHLCLEKKLKIEVGQFHSSEEGRNS